jgi:dTDP-4-amino-4,6-dideoxygalactose transaminase
VTKVFASGQFILGKEVEEFEAEFATYCGSGHAIACGNGTDALELALWAAGIRPGDEVILPSFTFAATAEAVIRCGAAPRFVDVDPMTLLIDPGSVERAITPKTTAIIPVHLYGSCADMSALLGLAVDRGIRVIEDAAQAHGARLGDRRAGAMGLAGCFSFYPGKNLGAVGDAGAIVTDDAELATLARMARDHGRTGKYEHAFPGRNSRMDALQAAVLRVKLAHLDDWNSRRRDLAQLYLSELVEADVQPVHPGLGSTPVYHLFVVQTAGRDELAGLLRGAGIMTGIHYPIPLHRQEAFAALSSQVLPETDEAAGRVLSLPIFPDMLEEEVLRVASAVVGFRPRP